MGYSEGFLCAGLTFCRVQSTHDLKFLKEGLILLKSEKQLRKSYETLRNDFLSAKDRKVTNIREEIDQIDLKILKLQKQRQRLEASLNKNEMKEFLSFETYLNQQQSSVTPTKEQSKEIDLEDHFFDDLFHPNSEEGERTESSGSNLDSSSSSTSFFS